MSLINQKEKIKLETKYFPLSFINTEEEVLKQIKNTFIFSYLLDKYDETTLQNYLISTQYGYTASALEKGKHKIVRITDINNGTVEWENVPFCDCDSEEKYLLKENDILIARTGGTTGKSFLVKDVPDNAVFASYLIRLRLKDDVEFEFINKFLNSYVFWSQIVEMKSGSAMPNVNAEKLKTLRIPKCDNKIQKEILKLFDNESFSIPELTSKIKTGELIFNNSNKTNKELKYQLSLIKQLRQAFLREAMQGLLVKTETNGETGAQLLKKIKAEKAQLIKEKKLKKEKELPPISEDEIPFEIPENWTWCRLGEICSTITKGSSPNWQGVQYVDEDKGILFITSKNVDSFKIDLAKATYVEEKFNDIEPRSILKKGDLLTNIVGASIGRTALFDLDVLANINQAVCILRIEHNFINKKFMLYLMNSDLALKMMFESQFAPGRANLSMSNIANFTIPMPSLIEQQQIVDKLDELMAFCDGLEESIKASQGVNEKLLQEVLREALQGESVNI